MFASYVASANSSWFDTTKAFVSFLRSPRPNGRRPMTARSKMVTIVRLVCIDEAGQVMGHLPIYSWLEDPGQALEPRIVQITGLCDEDLAGKQIDDEAVGPKDPAHLNWLRIASTASVSSASHSNCTKFSRTASRDNCRTRAEKSLFH